MEYNATVIGTLSGTTTYGEISLIDYLDEAGRLKADVVVAVKTAAGNYTTLGARLEEMESHFALDQWIELEHDDLGRKKRIPLPHEVKELSTKAMARFLEEKYGKPCVEKTVLLT